MTGRNGPEQPSPKERLKEYKTNEGSVFPVNHALARKVVKKMTVGTGMDEVRATNVAPVLNAIIKESPILFNEAVDSIREMQAEKVDESIVTDYLLGLSTAYSILKEQAEANDARLPSVSQPIIDSFTHDVEEMIPDASDEIDAMDRFMQYVEKLTEEEPGFMLPMREYAPDPQIDESQFSFLAAAVDTYSRIKRAEVSDRMNQDLAIE